MGGPRSRSGARWRCGGPCHALCCMGEVSTVGCVSGAPSIEFGRTHTDALAYTRQRQAQWCDVLVQSNSSIPGALLAAGELAPCAARYGTAWRLYRKPEQSGRPSHAVCCMVRQHGRLHACRPLLPAAGVKIWAGLAAPPCCTAALTISGGLAVRECRAVLRDAWKASGLMRWQQALEACLCCTARHPAQAEQHAKASGQDLEHCLPPHQSVSTSTAWCPVR